MNEELLEQLIARLQALRNDLRAGEELLNKHTDLIHLNKGVAAYWACQFDRDAGFVEAMIKDFEAMKEGAKNDENGLIFDPR